MHVGAAHAVVERENIDAAHSFRSIIQGMASSPRRLQRMMFSCAQCMRLFEMSARTWMSAPKYRWRDSAGWLRWEPRAIEGKDTSFEHLREFDMVLSRPAYAGFPSLRVPIRVVFDCHVVTEADLTTRAESVSHNPLYWVDSGGACRKFDSRRYACSHDLPELIRKLPGGQTKCYVGGNDNYLVCQRGASEGRVEFYQVYFDLYRPRDEDRLVMYVQSAYIKDVPNAADRKHEKVFATACIEKMGMIAKKLKGPRNKSRK
jgi:hypothetical protein